LIAYPKIKTKKEKSKGKECPSISKFNNIYVQERNFNWTKPEQCPRIDAIVGAWFCSGLL
jgi:hypothetical protein